MPCLWGWQTSFQGSWIDFFPGRDSLSLCLPKERNRSALIWKIEKKQRPRQLNLKSEPIAVRRGLISTGFSVGQCPGFGGEESVLKSLKL